MRKFFIEPENISGNCATITGSDAKHIRLVLRLNKNDTIKLFDGKGMIYAATITDITKTEIFTQITGSTKVQENPPFLYLAQGILKGKKMDFVVQKATELGVKELFPFTSQHCVSSTCSGKQVERWKRIIHESCKQCGRAIPMKCHYPQELDIFLTQNTHLSQKIILWEKEERLSFHNLENHSCKESSILIIGPEGGFATHEIDLAKSNGFTSIGLGSNILRAETAAITAISISQFILGNLCPSRS